MWSLYLPPSDGYPEGHSPDPPNCQVQFRLPDPHVLKGPFKAIWGVRMKTKSGSAQMPANGRGLCVPGLLALTPHMPPRVSAARSFSRLPGCVPHLCSPSMARPQGQNLV